MAVATLNMIAKLGIARPCASLLLESIRKADGRSDIGFHPGHRLASHASVNFLTSAPERFLYTVRGSSDPPSSEIARRPLVLLNCETTTDNCVDRSNSSRMKTPSKSTCFYSLFEKIFGRIFRKVVPESLSILSTVSKEKRNKYW